MFLFWNLLIWKSVRKRDWKWERQQNVSDCPDNTASPAKARYYSCLSSSYTLNCPSEKQPEGGQIRPLGKRSSLVSSMWHTTEYILLFGIIHFMRYSKQLICEESEVTMVLLGLLQRIYMAHTHLFWISFSFLWERANKKAFKATIKETQLEWVLLSMKGISRSSWSQAHNGVMETTKGRKASFRKWNFKCEERPQILVEDI